MSNEEETPKEQFEKFAHQATIGDQDDPANWFTKIAFPSSDPKGMCRDAKKALLNCLRATDCYQKYGYTPRECLNDKALPGRNAECDKFETMLSACKWDTVSSTSHTEIQYCHILFDLLCMVAEDA
eukprot:sb/3475550/